MSETAVAALRTDKEVALDGEKEPLENIVDFRGEGRRVDESLEGWRRVVSIDALELEGARMVDADVTEEELL